MEKCVLLAMMADGSGGGRLPAEVVRCRRVGANIPAVDWEMENLLACCKYNEGLVQVEHGSRCLSTLISSPCACSGSQAENGEVSTEVRGGLMNTPSHWSVSSGS
jgi:hypothetical protein